MKDIYRTPEAALMMAKYNKYAFILPLVLAMAVLVVEIDAKGVSNCHLHQFHLSTQLVNFVTDRAFMLRPYDQAWFWGRVLLVCTLLEGSGKKYSSHSTGE